MNGPKSQGIADSWRTGMVESSTKSPIGQVACYYCCYCIIYIWSTWSVDWTLGLRSQHIIKHECSTSCTMKLLEDKNMSCVISQPHPTWTSAFSNTQFLVINRPQPFHSSPITLCQPMPLHHHCCQQPPSSTAHTPTAYTDHNGNSHQHQHQHLNKCMLCQHMVKTMWHPQNVSHCPDSDDTCCHGLITVQPVQLSTLTTVPHSIFQYFTVPHLFLQEFGHSSGIPVDSCGVPLEFHWNKNGIKQTKVEILIYWSQFLKLCRYIHFCLPLPFWHHIYSSTLPLKFNFK